MTRPRGDDDVAGAETVGAMLLFGLFVTVIALLNVTAVPQAGLEAEVIHFEDVLNSINGLATSGEAAALPGATGATVGAAFKLGPDRDVGKDFLSFFLATPARASGELSFMQDYGNVTLSRYVGASPTPRIEIGSATSRLPMGRLTFDPNPIFRDPGVAQLELGGVVQVTNAVDSMRFDPPVSVRVVGSDTLVTVKARILNGTDQNVGGTAAVRVTMETEAATLRSPVSNDASKIEYRLETSYGPAWGAYLNETATDAGLASGSGYDTVVSRGTGEGSLDVVTWTVYGVGSGNDVRLTRGTAVFTVRFS